MNNSVKVSIVVPVYNVPEKYLKQCVDSLIKQTLKDIEIILVDDGTPNTSGVICDELSKKDTRIKVIHKENKGLCGARNTGVRNAKGDWISFIDGDDWIDPDAYQNLYKLGTENDVDVVMFGYVKDYPSKSVFMNYDKYFENEKIYKTEEEIKYLQKMVLNYNANCAMAPTKFIKREIIEKYDIYHDEKLRQGAEGIEFNIRLFSKIKSAIFINKPYYHYIYNDESITTVHNEKNHQMVLECFKKIKSEIDNNDEELMKWFYDRMNYCIATTAISGYFSESNKENYKLKKRHFKEYLRDELVKETLEKVELKQLNSRKLLLILIKFRMFALISLMSKMRHLQRERMK